MNPWQVMAHPVRRYLVDLLARSEGEAGELAEMVQHNFGIGWPAVSRHLKILHASGFVRVRREWSNRLYRLDDGAIDRLERVVAELRRRWTDRVGEAYWSSSVPDDDPWPGELRQARLRDPNEAIDDILRDMGYDPETGKRIPATRHTSGD